MRISDWSSDVCSSDLPRSENDETEREIGRKGLDGEEKERRDERQAQIQWVEAEILAHGLADTEEGVAAAEEVGGSTVHFFVFPFGCGHRPFSSEERRVVKEGVRTCRHRWSPNHEKHIIIKNLKG